MIFVITFEAPYSPVWEEGVLHSLIYSAVSAGEESPVILQTSKEWAVKVYDSDLVQLFVDYIRLDAELIEGMKPYSLTDGPLPEEWELGYKELIEAQDGTKGL